VLALVVLDHDHAEHAAAAADRRAQDRQALIGAGHGAAHAGGVLLRDRAEERAHTLMQKPIRRLVLRGNLARPPRRQTAAVLDGVEAGDGLGLRVPPADAQVLAAEDLLQLVADPLDDRLEVEPGRHPLVNAVGQGQLAAALLELKRHLGAATRTRKLDGAAPREPGHAVAIGGGEAAVAAVDVGVEEAEPLAARPSGATMQLRWRRASTPSGPWRSFALPVRRASSSQGAIAASSPAGCSAPRQQKADTRGAAFRFEQQHHPSGTAERGRLGDQPVADRRPLASRARRRVPGLHPPPLIDRLSSVDLHRPIIRHARRSPTARARSSTDDDGRRGLGQQRAGHRRLRHRETADSRLEVIAIVATAAARRTLRGMVFMAGLLRVVFDARTVSGPPTFGPLPGLNRPEAL
jgi:hypothetical protein